MAVSVIFWTTVNAFDTPSDDRVLQAPNGASRDRHQCVLAGHLARALDRTRWPPQTISTPNSAAMPIKAPSTAIISNRSRSRSLSRRSNTSPQDCRQRTRIRLSAFRPDGAEPLCLFLVTSASWRLRGVKTPPKQRSNGEQPQGALASERRGSNADGSSTPYEILSSFSLAAILMPTCSALILTPTLGWPDFMPYHSR